MRITYPSIDKLLSRVDSRYSLSVLAAKRAHELEAGDPPTLEHFKCDKAVGKALEKSRKIHFYGHLVAGHVKRWKRGLPFGLNYSGAKSGFWRCI